MRRLDDPSQQPMVADDDDVLLLPAPDKVAHPARARDVLGLGRLERAAVLVPLGLGLDVRPVEPRLREVALRLGQVGARVAGVRAALCTGKEGQQSVSPARAREGMHEPCSCGRMTTGMGFSAAVGRYAEKPSIIVWSVRRSGETRMTVSDGSSEAKKVG